jgi:hypothetical protein
MLPASFVSTVAIVVQGGALLFRGLGHELLCNLDAIGVVSYRKAASRTCHCLTRLRVRALGVTKTWMIPTESITVKSTVG